eukprot:tig00021035_g17261.t1
MADDAEWVYEAMSGYFRSKDWADTIDGFLRDHAALFASSSTPQDVQRAAFSSYRDLTSALLASLLSELGVPGRQVEAVVRRHSRPDSHEKGWRAISATDSFSAFVSFMRGQKPSSFAASSPSRGHWEPEPRGDPRPQQPQQPQQTGRQQRSPMPSFRHEMAGGGAGAGASPGRRGSEESDWELREAVRLSREETRRRALEEEEAAALELALALSLSLTPEADSRIRALEDEAEEKALDIVREAQSEDDGKGGKPGPGRGRPVPPPAVQAAPTLAAPPASGSSSSGWGAPPPSGSRRSGTSRRARRRPSPSRQSLSPSASARGRPQPPAVATVAGASAELSSLAPLPPPRDGTDALAEAERRAFEAEVERVSEVLPGFLYLGSAKGAAKRALLDSLGVDLVVNVSRKCPNLYPDEFRYVHWEIRDSLDEDIARYFADCNRILALAKRSGEVVLVHCMQGVSRSATLVLAFLMGVEGMSLRGALKLVHAARPIACPNRNFFAQLLRYEMELFGGQSSIRVEGAPHGGLPAGAGAPAAAAAAGSPARRPEAPV